MPRASLLTATLATLALMAVTAGSAAADPAYVPGELIVKREGARAATTVAVRDGRSVKDAARALSDRPGVAYARPNYIAHATAYTPNDPGFPLQWNLATSAAGINMPEAWGIARQLGRSGGKDTIVAVLDTGVAYQRFRRFRRAPGRRPAGCPGCRRRRSRSRRASGRTRAPTRCRGSAPRGRRRRTRG